MGKHEASPTTHTTRLNKRMLTLGLVLALLLMSTTGVLGYIIGKNALPQDSLPSSSQRNGQVIVSSLQPIEAPTTGFERLSLLGQVVNARGIPQAQTPVTLSLNERDHPAAYQDDSGFAFTELIQGDYQVRVNGATGFGLSLEKTQDQGEAGLYDLGNHAWLLRTYPATGTVALNIVLMDDQAQPSLLTEAPIGPSAYQVWERDTPAHIFDERLGNAGVRTMAEENIAAPDANGSFVFVVNNPEPHPIEVSVSLRHADENSPALPLTYRLYEDAIPEDKVRPEDFLAGEGWQPAEDLLAPSVWIPAQHARFYTLQWRWDGSDDARDTLIGSQEGRPRYTLWVEVRQTMPLPDSLTP